MFDFLGGKKGADARKDPLSQLNRPMTFSSGQPPPERNPFEIPPQRPRMNEFSPLAGQPGQMNQYGQFGQQGHSGQPGGLGGSTAAGQSLPTFGNTSNPSFSRGENSYSQPFSGSQHSFTEEQHFSARPEPSVQSVSGPTDSVLLNKNMEIILTKLDAIRTAIQNLDHRIASIENALQQKASKEEYGKW